MLGITLDTCIINSKGRVLSMNKLEQWHEDDVITIEISEPAQLEARSGNNSLRNQKAISYIFSETRATTDDEMRIMKKIESILFPGGAKTKNEQNDVQIVFNAWKYCRRLVTNDGASRNQPNGILGNIDKLRALGIRVMRDNEAVALVEQKIKERDNMARLLSEKTRQLLPYWVGKD